MSEHKEEIKCPICETVKTITVSDMPYNYHNLCDHEEKEYIEYIRKLIERNESLVKEITHLNKQLGKD